MKTNQATLIPPRIHVNNWTVLLTMLLGFFMILLDTTIVNVAIPQMERGLNTTFDNILWVLNGYVLVYAVLLITAGRLGDMFGPKRMFLAGLILFTASSFACGVSQSVGQLIAFRVLQGLGGALLAPQTLTMITYIFPPEQRGVAFGLWGVVGGISATVGPILGGWLVTNYSWQAVFFINVPIGIFAAIGVFLVAPEARTNRRHNLDLPGVLLVSLGMFLGIFALIEGQHYSWGPISSVGTFSIGDTRWGILSIYSFLVYSVVVLTVFVLMELRTEQPLLPIDLLKIRNFALGNAVYAIVGLAIFPIFTPIVIFLQSVLGFSAIHSGLTTIPVSLGVLVASPITGRLSDLGWGKRVLLLGPVLFVIGILVLRQVLALDNSSWNLTIPFALMGIGMGCMFAPLTTLTLAQVRPADAGSASGFLNTMQQAGGAIGIAVVGAVLSKSTAAALPVQAARFSPQVPPAFRGKFLAGWQAAGHGAQEFGTGQSGGFQLPAGIPMAIAHKLTALDFQVFGNALLTGTRDSLLVAPAAMLVGFILIALMRGKVQSAGETDETELVAAR